MTDTVTTNPYRPPLAAVADVPAGVEPPFFAVSIEKLVMMSVLTLGFYQIVWFVKHWQRIKLREGSRISPGPRAVFAVFFCYACFRRIRKFAAPGPGAPDFAAGPLALGWIVVSLLERAPSGWWIVSLASVVFLIPVQTRANHLNAVMAPGHDPNASFTSVNWVCMVLGGMLTLVGLIGTLAAR